MQNHLDEFFAMVDFCNPGVLGTPSQFRRYYEARNTSTHMLGSINSLLGVRYGKQIFSSALWQGPIVAGREPDATEEVVAKGAERSSELSAIVNNFILRRTNSLLSAHLPPKARLEPLHVADAAHSPPPSLCCMADSCLLRPQPCHHTVSFEKGSCMCNIVKYDVLI